MGRTVRGVSPQHRAASRLALPRPAAAGLAALVVALGAAVALRAWATGGGEVVPLGEPTTATMPATTPEAAPTPESVTVHVTGAVLAPGVYQLPLGARVDDALAAGGGLRADADESALNRAQVLLDAQQVYVPVIGESSLAAPGEASSGAAGGPVNLNRATAAELEALPGIGPSLAAQIVAWRDQHGPFSSVEDLDEVPGIGPAILDRVRTLATV